MSQFDSSYRRYTDAGIIRRTISGRFVAEINRDYKRRRQAFDTEAEALGWLAGKAMARNTEGKAALELTTVQVRDAQAALAWLRENEHADSLLAVAESFVEAHRPTDEPVYTGAAGETVATWAQRYFDHLVDPDDGFDAARPRTMQSKKNRLAGFLERFGAMPIGSVTIDDVNGFLSGTGATGRNLRNYQIEVQALFSFATKKYRGQASNFTNTAARFPQRKKREVEPAATMQAAEVKRFLHTLEAMGRDNPAGKAEDVALVMALGCFAGVRTSELADAYGEVLQWEHIDFDEKQIIIPASVAKTRRRREVPITPNLMQWLLRYGTGPDGKERTGQIAPGHATCTRRRKEAEAATGIAWVANGARHSFGTYYGRLHGYRAAAEAMGHEGGMRIFEQHYKGATVRRKTAQEYFEIEPLKVKAGKMLRLKGAA